MKLFIVRGLPGSGKSTLAKQLCSNHFEADQFFMKDGVYNFDIGKIGMAHEWCQRQVFQCLENNQDVAVSNTFTTIRELKPYFEMARLFNIVPTVITCQNQFKNVHDVPVETLEKMKNRFVWDISVLFEELKGSHANNR